MHLCHTYMCLCLGLWLCLYLYLCLCCVLVPVPVPLSSPWPELVYRRWSVWSRAGCRALRQGLGKVQGCAPTVWGVCVLQTTSSERCTGAVQVSSGPQAPPRGQGGPERGGGGVRKICRFWKAFLNPPFHSDHFELGYKLLLPFTMNEKQYSILADTQLNQLRLRARGECFY